MTAPSTKEVAHYLDLFGLQSKALKQTDPAWFDGEREKALARFAHLGFPTLRDEAWHATPLTSLLQTSFSINGKTGNSKFDGLSSPEETKIVFMNGHYSPDNSSSSLPHGVTLSPLSETIKKENLLPFFKKDSTNSFEQLNAAFFQDGAFLRIAKGTFVEKPIHLIFISTSLHSPLFFNPFNLILAEENSRATIVESYQGQGNYFNNAMTRIYAGSHAVLDHYKLQEESQEAIHIASVNIEQESGSHVFSHSLAFGARLSRNNIHASLNAVGADCALDGFFLGHDRQLLDHHILVDHHKPQGTSNQLYKGILDDEAKGILHGTVLVHEGAKKTDAHQQLKSLLLSDKAESLPEPQLKILNDDVKCTHGAAVGQLDKKALFYLRSRGIEETAARNMLTRAFGNEVIERIKVEGIRKRVLRILDERLKKDHA